MVGGDHHCQALSYPSSWEKIDIHRAFWVADTTLSCTLILVAFGKVNICCNPDRILVYCQLLQVPLISAASSQQARSGRTTMSGERLVFLTVHPRTVFRSNQLVGSVDGS